MGNIGVNKAKRTPESNEYYTPYYAVIPILKYIPKNKKIWCPFDREWSAFYQTFKGNGYDVIRSHIDEGKDFFEYEPEEYDIIISNPPYNIKDDILRRLDELNKSYAMLLPLSTLQGKKRYPYLKNGIQLLAFDDRVMFHNMENMKNTVNSIAFGTAYFCRNVLPKDLILEKLYKYEEPLVE